MILVVVAMGIFMSLLFLLSLSILPDTYHTWYQINGFCDDAHRVTMKKKMILRATARLVVG